MDDEPEWFVDSIKQLRYNRRKRQYEYLVKWAGYDELSWEPAENLKDVEAANRFHDRYPDEPDPRPDT